MVFSKSYCPYCKSTKKKLDGLGVKYKTLELNEDSACLLSLPSPILLPLSLCVLEQIQANDFFFARNVQATDPPSRTLSRRASTRTRSLTPRPSAACPTPGSAGSTLAATMICRLSARTTSSRSCRLPVSCEPFPVSYEINTAAELTMSWWRAARSCEKARWRLGTGWCRQMLAGEDNICLYTTAAFCSRSTVTYRRALWSRMIAGMVFLLICN